MVGLRGLLFSFYPAASVSRSRAGAPGRTPPVAGCRAEAAVTKSRHDVHGIPCHAAALGGAQICSPIELQRAGTVKGMEIPRAARHDRIASCISRKGARGFGRTV